MTQQKSFLNPDDKNTALEMAIADFEQFCTYAGVNQTQLKVCIERNKGLSLGQISQKLNISKNTIKGITDRCFSQSPKDSKK